MKNQLTKYRYQSLLAGIIMLFALPTSWSQQEAQFTQYLDNMQYYNPAYVGSRDAMNLTLLHRQQWVGFKGAPMSTSLSFHTPLKLKGLGIGISALNDKWGPVNSTWVDLDISYSLKFKKGNGQLSFGVKGGLNILNSSFGNLYQVDEGDPMVAEEYRNSMLGNIGAGIYYHSDHFFAGVAVPRIGEDLTISDGNIKYADQRHYYLMIGGYFNVNRMLKIRPSAMVKMTENAPLAIDGSLAFIFYDKFWLGANYRVLESAGFIAQYQISPQFKLGYGFDLPTTQLIRHSYGTHELLLSIDFVFNKKKIITPRFF